MCITKNYGPVRNCRISMFRENNFKRRGEKCMRTQNFIFITRQTKMFEFNFYCYLQLKIKRSLVILSSGKPGIFKWYFRSNWLYSFFLIFVYFSNYIKVGPVLQSAMSNENLYNCLVRFENIWDDETLIMDISGQKVNIYSKTLGITSRDFVCWRNKFFRW